MRFLSSLVFNIIFYISIIFASLSIIILYPFKTTISLQYIAAFWVKSILLILKKLCGVSWEVSGAENIPKTPCIFVSNHQGQWETYSMQYLFHPMCTLLKKELLYNPLWGWAMKMLHPIAINRNKPKEAILQTLEEGSNRLQNGMYVLLFPEGTRVKAGRVGEYARSSFELAKRNSVMVLPLCHNSGDCWPAHKFIKKPGKITLIIGEPFYVEDSRQSATDVRECLEKNLNS